MQYVKILVLVLGTSLYRGKMWPRDPKYCLLYEGFCYNGVRYIGVFTPKNYSNFAGLRYIGDTLYNIHHSFDVWTRAYPAGFICCILFSFSRTRGGYPCCTYLFLVGLFVFLWNIGSFCLLFTEICYIKRGNWWWVGDTSILDILVNIAKERITPYSTRRQIDVQETSISTTRMFNFFRLVNDRLNGYFPIQSLLAEFDPVLCYLNRD